MKINNKSPESKPLSPQTFITDLDSYLFKEGNHFRLFEKLGAHTIERDGAQGTHFAVWAPNADKVSVIGNFNGWNKESHPLHARWDSSGIFEGFIPHLGAGEIYKYFIISKHNGYTVEKCDPFAFLNETPPKTASVIWNLDYQWRDQKWMETRYKKNALDKPIAIYEVHPGSWRRKLEEYNRSLNYREMAQYLVEYVKKTGFTHVEFLPVMEHPFYGSWGYQTTGYFAPTQRYGTPQDFMYLIDCLHQNDIGIILDWVPSHFPSDQHSLVYFDGSHLYEHSDPKEGYHPDWKSYIFNLGRNEVKEFLISSAMFWLEKYHIDGLRVDAVASMLYRDYSRPEGDWVPNQYGGRENLESVNFLKTLNTNIYKFFPDVQMYAEESTAWPGVSRPVEWGGLGFGMKWNMGWMHDVLKYMSKDPIYRKHHHNELTFSFLYTFSENYVISLSHDEVVHGKGSLLGRMPGDIWQKFANLRLLFSYMYAHPGKKLLFMGGEIGQWVEWNHEQSVEWHLLKFPYHQGVQNCVADLNKLYRSEKALYQYDINPSGLRFLDASDYLHSVISFIRNGERQEDSIVAVCNFTPMTYHDYRLGVPESGFWRELFNSDAPIYGGSGQGNLGGKHSQPVPYQGYADSITLTVPPLGVVFLKKDKLITGLPVSSFQFPV